jgi:hypothetical protein
MNNQIKVIDSPVGSGKTTWAINYISKIPGDTKVIFITPYIDEVKRIIKDCKSRLFIQPTLWEGGGRKMNHLIELVAKGSNIASTHALFSMIDDDLINALKANNYILILDEVMDVVEKFNLYNDVKKIKNDVIEQFTKDDIHNLLQNKYITVQDDFLVKWTNKDVLHKYESLKKLADRELLYLVNNSLLLWTFPIEVFREGIFSEIYILTYQFEYQLQAFYYHYFNLEYSLYHVEGNFPDYNIVPTTNNDYEIEWIKKVKPLINILDNSKLNKIGSNYKDVQNRIVSSSLSKNWYSKNPELIKVLRNNCNNLFHNIFICKPNEKMWTTFKDYAKQIKSIRMPIGKKSKNKKTNTSDEKKIIPNFVELNARATNDYSHKTKLAYLINRYQDPYIEKFFENRISNINWDGYALSELVQWVWRSAIRNMKPIEVYIPSERMRTLFENWLNGIYP